MPALEAFLVRIVAVVVVAKITKVKATAVATRLVQMESGMTYTRSQTFTIVRKDPQLSPNTPHAHTTHE